MQCIFSCGRTSSTITGYVLEWGKATAKKHFCFLNAFSYTPAWVTSGHFWKCYIGTAPPMHTWAWCCFFFFFLILSCFQGVRRHTSSHGIAVRVLLVCPVETTSFVSTRFHVISSDPLAWISYPCAFCVNDINPLYCQWWYFCSCVRQTPAKSVGPSMSHELGIVAGVQAAPG